MGAFLSAGTTAEAPTQLLAEYLIPPEAVRSSGLRDAVTGSGASSQSSPSGAADRRQGPWSAPSSAAAAAGAQRVTWESIKMVVSHTLFEASIDPFRFGCPSLNGIRLQSDQ